MKHEVIDGVDVFTFRQSWIGTFTTCPEQARLDMLGQLQRVETDATAIGTAVHAGIEAVLAQKVDGDEALELALAEFARLERDPTFQYKQTTGFQQCTDHVVNCFTSWHEFIYPQLGEPLSVERNFKVKLDERGVPILHGPTAPCPPGCKPLRSELWLSGTWDLDDSAWGIVDWKNKGHEIKRWEVDRWSVQPTVYTYAKRVLDGLDMDEPMDFTFVNMVKGPVREPQIVTVSRQRPHYEWLRAMLWRIVDLYWATDAGRIGWPMNDGHVLCSTKWCTEFAAGRCKGAYLTI